MADRRVARTGKDLDKDITKLCGTWGSQSKTLAISDIESGKHMYYVHEAGYRSEVHVYTGADGKKHLRTYADATSRNNLDNLPDC